MKIKIIQYFIGDNQKYLKLSKLCEEINKKYCNLHGYDFEYQYLTEEDIKKVYKVAQCSRLQIVFYKHIYIYNNLGNNGYDYIVFLDGDAAVNNPNIKIEDLVDTTHQFFLTRGNDRIGEINTLHILYKSIFKRLNDRQKLLEGKIEDICNFGADVNDLCQHVSLNIPFNEGMFIIKNTKIMKEFFKDCRKIFDYKKNVVNPLTGGIDGRTISLTLQLKKYNSLYAYLYNQAQGGLANSYETVYNVDKTFILHNYGEALNLDQKIDWVKSLKQNKWWKPILEKEN